jgi:cbb3-type cytochrome oxidase subunit 3
MSDLVALASWFQHYGLVFMVLIFIGIWVTSYLPQRKATLEQRGKIIFGDDR